MAQYIGITTLQRLLREANAGNEQSERRLFEYSRDLSKLANKRLERLEKAGRDYYAYDKAITYTQTVYGTNRFRYDYMFNTTPADFYENILQARDFLSRETSTVSGQKRVEKRRLEAFRERGLNIPKNKEAERAFIDFLNDSDTLDALKNIYGSNDLFQRISNMLVPRNTRTKRLQEIAALAAAQTGYSEIDKFFREKEAEDERNTSNRLRRDSDETTDNVDQ